MVVNDKIQIRVGAEFAIDREQTLPLNFIIGNEQIDGFRIAVVVGTLHLQEHSQEMHTRGIGEGSGRECVKERFCEAVEQGDVAILLFVAGLESFQHCVPERGFALRALNGLTEDALEERGVSACSGEGNE